MNKRYMIFVLCCFLLLSGCTTGKESISQSGTSDHSTSTPPSETRYQRIRLSKDIDINRHVNADTVVINTAEKNLPTQLPIYEIKPRPISEEEFQQIQEQVKTVEIVGSQSGWELDGNCIRGLFVSYGTGTFTLSDEELEAMAWETFNQIPFSDGEYEYVGHCGEVAVEDQGEMRTTSVRVAFRRVLDGVRLSGHDICTLSFNDSGLVEFSLNLYDYEVIGTMDLVPLEDAEAKIKAPDSFVLEPDSGIVSTLQVDQIKLQLCNHSFDGCTILQPVYHFIGTAIMKSGKQAEFTSTVIAIPESYTYEAE